MANTLVLNTTQVWTGLCTLTYTVTSAGFYRVTMDTTVVTPSSLVVVVNQNGSPIYTAPAVTPTQIGLRFKISFLAAVNDVITVVLSSSAAIDSIPDNVLSNLSIGQGA